MYDYDLDIVWVVGNSLIIHIIATVLGINAVVTSNL